MKLKIGTRGSKLALWQAETVKSELQNVGIEAELVLYKSEGDQNQTQALREIGGQGLFTKVLDNALLKGEIDLAVHSTKDMTSRLVSGLTIAAFLKREDPRDVLLSNDKSIDLDNLSRELVIGTSSMRRQAFLRHYSPHVTIKDIRGNVDTRIEKMEKGEYDGIILAYAGIKRLGLTDLIVRKLNVSSFTPPPGQGAVAVVMQEDHSSKEKIYQALNHPTTEKAMICERSFLRTIDGGCSVPAFGLATVIGDTLSFEGGMASEKKNSIVRESLDGSARDAESIGIEVGNKVLTKIERVNTL